MTTMLQQGTVYRYLRADASKDVSSDVLELSLDGGVTWAATGVTYIAPEDRPPEVTAADAAQPAAAGFTGYWWRILTGPDGDWPLKTGVTTLRGRLTDSPEIPHFAWLIRVNETD